MIIGAGGGSAYEIVANGLGDPIISYLNATDKITDEQALAGQLVLALSGKVNTKTINEIKLFLTKQIKKTGKNPKQIAKELKEEIVNITKNDKTFGNAPKLVILQF